jgi:hypothetical protein
MKIGFDEFGNLMPNDVIQLSWVETEQLLVTSNRRRFLWNCFMVYNNDLSQVFQCSWKQWLGGSYLTKISTPNDIDLVNFVNWHDTLEQHELLLGSLFMANNSKQKYNIDAYFTVVYPPDDERYVSTVERTNYWQKWLGQNKHNKKSRGIIELQIQQPWLL